MMPRARFLAALLMVSLIGCADGQAPPDEEPATPRGSYEIDRETGETIARHEDEDGAVTTMRSGPGVPPVLPDRFTLYPGARVTNTTRVERDGLILLTVDLESGEDPAAIVAYYRAEALEAGFAIEVDLEGSEGVTLTGRSAGGDTLSLVAANGQAGTRAQLTLALAPG
ncbi:hypothetical protein K3172_05730 [Qipengyuania sp. 6B39]|uniref:hypothetical protein n=1 Tax=Qipengyuania proteolytica TaxID=2867239 RepID=UPI001C89329E|nr:hypothetical protein [Qipengyuania proteolytica]MBX7495352.1 hypothetical protein [Qipengyuania proteolytica]